MKKCSIEISRDSIILSSAPVFGRSGIQDAIAQELEGGPDDKKQYNFTDPESRIMKTNNKGWDQCGNAQAVVDVAIRSSSLPT